MSGPKTSELSIARMQRQLIARLRDRLTSRRSSYHHGLVSRLARLESLVRSCPAAGDLLEQAREIAAAANAELKEIAHWEPGSNLQRDIDALEARFKPMEDCANAAFAALDKLIGRAEELNGQAHAAKQIESFAASIAGLEADSADITGELERAQAYLAQIRAEAEHPEEDDSLKLAQDALVRTAELVCSKSLLAKDRLHLADALKTLSEGVTGNHAEALAHACSCARQLKVLFPTVQANARAHAEQLSRIEVLADDLRSRGIDLPTLPPSFSTLEEADAFLKKLEELTEEADRDAYLRSCIDKVMADHGYDVARSVTLQQNAGGAGEHVLYSGSAEENGIHAYRSPNGDLMLEVVGMPQEDVSDGEAVQIEKTDSVTRQDELLAAQTRFCSVYEEIAADLAAYGIVNESRYKAEPSLAHSKVVTTAASNQATEQEQAQKRRRKTKRADAPMAREMK